MTKKYTMLVKVDSAGNNNKFYEIKLNDDDSVVIRYGRNGDQGVTLNKGHGEATFDKLVKSKTAASKGYKPVEIMSGISDSSTGEPTESLADVAKRDIANNDPILADLLDRLAKINRYQLLAATGDQIDIVDGVVKTVLGPVTLDAVKTARDLLNQIKDHVDAKNYDDDFRKILNGYLSVIPQKVPRSRGWDTTFFDTHSSFQKQSDLLDQIQTSIENYKPPVKEKEDNSDPVEIQKIFSHSLRKVEDADEIQKIRDFYESNLNRSHVSSSLRLKNVYAIINDESTEKYEKALKRVGGNEQLLWHGTRAFNVLSILKGGLIIPTSAGGYNITGRMFGDGVYFSDQSTKSLNYAYGYWGGGGYESNCFMFLAKVAMGKSYVPPGPFNGKLPPGFDSTFAKGRQSGVANNEMIVYSLDQVNLTYLCEFDK